MQSRPCRGSEERRRAKGRKRELHTDDINGVALFAYDEDGSLAADRVAGELGRRIRG